MALVYHVDIENTSGETIAIIKNPISFSCSIRVSQKGDYQLVVSGFDPVVDSFGDDYIIRFWRKDTQAINSDFVNIFNGIHKTYNKSLTQSGNKTFTSYGPDSVELLDKSYILYAPNSPQASKSLSASTAMVEFVRENIGDLATVANGRRTDGTNPIVISGVSGLGDTWSDNVANKNLLIVLQNIRDFTKENDDQVDFVVNYLGSYTWEFLCGDVYDDRTNYGLNPANGRNASGNIPIVFSPLFNNVKNFNESHSRYNEANTITAIGNGVGSLQQTVTLKNTDSSLKSAIAQRENVVNSNDSSATQLISAAQSALYEYVSRPKISFEPLLNSVRLWDDFFPGDFVTAMTENNETYHLQLTEVSIDVSQSENGSTIERLNLNFDDAVGFN